MGSLDHVARAAGYLRGSRSRLFCSVMYIRTLALAALLAGPAVRQPSGMPVPASTETARWTARGR